MENNTQLSSGKDQPYWINWLYNLGLLFRVLQTVATFLLNGGACLVILYRKRWRQAKGVFLLSLTVNDLLLSLTLMPAQIIAYVRGPDIADSFVCTMTFIPYAQPNSLFCLVILCVDRLIAIISPYWYLAHVGKKRAVYVAVGQWMVTGILLLVRTFTAKPRVYNDEYLACTNASTGGPVSTTYYIISYLIIVLSSGYVYYIAASQRRRIRAQDRISGSHTNMADSAIIEEFKAVLHLVLIYILTAIAGFLRSIPSGKALWLKPFLPWVIYSNALLNTLLHAYKTEWFREGCKEIVIKLKHRFRNKVSSEVAPTNQINESI